LLFEIIPIYMANAMTQGLFTPDEVSAMILAGDKLLLAGDADLLSQLPAGNWIGGSTPYFILYPENRTTSLDKIFVNQLPDFITQLEIREYDETNIQNIFNDGPQNGFTMLIMPYATPVAMEYAINATNYTNFAAHPVCGWLSGRLKEIITTEKSCTASGIAPGILSEKGVAMHISLPESKYAEIHIFNPYKQGDGDSIVFEESALRIKDAIINGDSNIIATIIRNLLTNAIKFTASGGQVALTVEPSENGKYTITVSDTGTGMSEEQLQNLFKLDSTFHRKGTADEQGSGLGLIVCKELLEKHGSVLHVESEEGKGSTFLFEI